MYFCLKTEYFPRISCVGANVTPEFFKHGPRTPDEYILYIVTRGEMYLSENNIQYKLESGDFLLLQPGYHHYGFQESSCSYYYLHFPECIFSVFDCSSFESIENILINNKALFYKANPFGYELYERSKLFIPKDRHLSPSCLHAVELCMKEILRAGEQKNEHFKLLCSCKFIEILTKLSTDFSESLFRDAGKNKKLHQNNQKIQEVIDLLNNHFADRITGRFIAEHLNMNYDYLNRTFKNHLGITIFEYLNIIRINKSKELLMNGTKKAHEIAACVGYCDEYHFSKSFKKSTGITPSQYIRSL